MTWALDTKTGVAFVHDRCFTYLEQVAAALDGASADAGDLADLFGCSRRSSQEVRHRYLDSASPSFTVREKPVLEPPPHPLALTVFTFALCSMAEGDADEHTGSDGQGQGRRRSAAARGIALPRFSSKAEPSRDSLIRVRGGR